MKNAYRFVGMELEYKRKTCYIDRSILGLSNQERQKRRAREKDRDERCWKGARKQIVANAYQSGPEIDDDETTNA